MPIAAGVVLPFGFGATSFAPAAGIVRLVGLPPRAPGEIGRFWSALMEELAGMRDHPTILRLASMPGAIDAVFASGMTVLLPNAQEALDLTAGGHGRLLAGGALGGLVAPASARRCGCARRSCWRSRCPSGVESALEPVSSGGRRSVRRPWGGTLWKVVTVSYRCRHIARARIEAACRKAMASLMKRV